MTSPSVSARRFDSRYLARFAAARMDWSDEPTAREVLGILDELLPRTGITRGDLLELGCGTGTITFPLTERGYRVTGLDISAVAVAHARRRARASGAEATFHVHDITTPMPALAGRFALVVDSLALHYVTGAAERLRAVRLARSALAPDGAMVVMTMCGEPRRIPSGSRFDPRTRCLESGGIAECHYARPADLVDLFRSAGLRPCHTTLVEGCATTGDQDMYLAILRPAGGRPGAAKGDGT
ncbi:class I SAM-dependent methyltransferase [Catellatospora sp. KI3]|uniref:class I SAM-dependent methyltransferase n=1 Tax=Catellatospora sp. KI3 TaxID=3041620 RepID=UPI002482EDEA|nr:class I SAM-dependent methyltransferase [Catellatospora sp. KI3]MDI1465400.1 class I SAM-dependent methyltransferase [Catellatospora sp. KI3]